MNTNTIRTNIFIICAIFLAIGAFKRVVYYDEANLIWDFQAFWSGAKALHLGLDPYQFHDIDKEKWIVPFYSPIFLAIFYKPLALMSLENAKHVMTIINLLCATAIIGLLLKLSKLPLNTKFIIISASLLFSFEPFNATLFLGQTDLVVVLSMVVSWYFLDTKKHFISGLSICVGALNPHLILGMCIYYLYRSFVRKEYYLFGGMLTGGILLVLISLRHTQYALEWIRVIIPTIQKGILHNYLQITTIHTIVTFLGVDGIYPTLVNLCLALVAIAMSCRIWILTKENLHVDIAVSVVLTLILTSYAFSQDLLILILTIPGIITLWREGFPLNKLAFLAVTSFSILFSSMTGYFNPVINSPIPLFNYFSPFITLIMILSVVKITDRSFTQSILYTQVAVALSLIGSLLPHIMGEKAMDYETLLIVIGWFLFLRAIQLWHEKKERTIESI